MNTWRSNPASARTRRQFADNEFDLPADPLMLEPFIGTSGQLGRRDQRFLDRLPAETRKGQQVVNQASHLARRSSGSGRRSAGARRDPLAEIFFEQAGKAIHRSQRRAGGRARRYS